jgi:hypothetical protein
MKKGTSRNRPWSYGDISQVAASPALNYAPTKGLIGPGALPWGTFAPLSFVSRGTGVSAAELPFRWTLNADLVELRWI